MPRISVIIPTYNCGKFIGQTLESVFAQTYRDYEVIVVDDGSTDKTCDVIDYWAKRIIYFEQSNRGPSAARNLAVLHATGEFLAYLDADDQWFPYKLERQIAYFDAHPECGLVHSDVTVIDEGNKIIYHSFDQEKSRPILQGNCVNKLLRHSCIHMPSVMERHTCFNEVGSFEERIRYAEDYLHWLRLVLAGHSLGYIKESLALYRLRAGSLSQIEHFVSAKSIEMSKSLLTVFSILQDEYNTNILLDLEAKAIVYEQINKLRFDLAYQYRKLGNNGLARHFIFKLLSNSPIKIQYYIELLKSCVPPFIIKILNNLMD